MTESERLNASGDKAMASAGEALASGRKDDAARKFDEAMGYYERALEVNPDYLAAAASLGAAGTSAGAYERVVQGLWRIAHKHPESLEVAFPLGVALFKTGRYEQAIPLLERVAARSSVEQLVTHYYLATFYLHQQRGEAAAEQLLRYLELRPPALEKNDFQLQLLLGQAYLQQFKPGPARAAFEAAQRGRDELLPAQLGLASVLVIEENVSEATKLLDGLVQRHPRSAEPLLLLGRVLLDEEELARADRVVQRLLKLDQGGDSQLLTAELRLAQGKLEEAERRAKKALEVGATGPEPQVVLARAVQAQGRHEEAIGLLSKAVETAPREVALLAALGTANRRAGRYQQAIEVHQRLERVAPNLPRTHLLLGGDYYAAGQWEQAIERYGEVLRREPRNPEARLWLSRSLGQRGRVHAQSGRIDDGLRDLQRAHEISPTPEAARNLGALLIERKRYADAQRILKPSVTGKGSTWRNRYLLGWAELGAGSAPDAQKSFERAARRTADPAARLEIQTGWALARLARGDVAEAIDKLSVAGLPPTAKAASDANLPLAYGRRALALIERGDAAAAGRDLGRMQAAKAPARSNAARLQSLIEGLLDERGNPEPEIRAAGLGTVAWARPQATALATAWANLQADRLPRARVMVSRALSKRATLAADQRAFAGAVLQAAHVRGGELAYRAGRFKSARVELERAAEGAPKSAALANNLAAARYASGQRSWAVSEWSKLVGELPEASLNLGIDAQVQQRNMAAAHSHYGQYLAEGGRNRSLIQGWRDRIEKLYAIGAGAQPGGQP